MTARDSKGRFKKGSRTKNEPENPDCEPATKGYVKCIARTGFFKIATTHIGSGSMWLLLSAAFGLLYLVGSSGSSQLTPNMATTLMCFISISFAISMHDYLIGFVFDRERPSVIEKYQLPTCEKKKDCE